MAVQRSDIRVLIGFAEAAAAPEVVFSLERAGFRISAFRRSGARASIRRLPGIELHNVAAPERDLDRSLGDIEALMAGGHIDVVMPLDDASLYLINRLAMAGRIPKTVTVAGAAGDNARLALDKRLQVAAAKEAGFAVPETAIVSPGADLSSLSRPFMLKPALAAELESDGAKLKRAKAAFVERPADLEKARTVLSGMSVGLVQPFIAGTGEGVFGLCRDGRMLAVTGHRRVRMTNPHGSGSCACISTIPAPPVLEAAGQFLRAAGWQGLFMIELLTDAAGTSWFMELNGRPWGSMALARRAGFEYPAWAVRSALDPAFVPNCPEPKPGLCVRHLGNELVHLMFVARGPVTGVHKAGWPRMAPTLAEVLKPQPGRTFYNWDAAHPGFFARDALDTVVRFVGQRMG